MRAAARGAFCFAFFLSFSSPSPAQNTFQEDRHLREYLWSSTVGQFVKFEPLRDERELPHTIGLLIYKEDDRWMEKAGCFPDLPSQLAAATTGSYSARSYRVWDRGRWPPPTPPVDVSILGSHVRFETEADPAERLQSLELQVSIPDAVIYRKSSKAFLAIANSRQFDEECLTLLREKESYVVSEVIVGREAYSYRRYTSQNLYPIKDAGPADFSEIRQGQYQRDKPAVLAYRALRPVWRRQGVEAVLTGFRPDALKARRGF